ncbi:MAG TPA: hypothetical protein VKG78_00190 [Opitutaceae bacterium]|nr:hypothetical protein [Opitutaceae bacterium]
MTLNPDQKKAVSEWVAAGDSLYTVQKKLAEELKVSMTYMDVRFLVDDLNLQLKDPEPKADASDVGKAGPAPEKKGFIEKAKEKLGLSPGGPAGPDEGMDAPPPSAVRVTVDKVTLNPSAMASGTVTFGDGVTAKWMVDHQGRPGLLEMSKPGYRPSAADAQAFMQELSLALQGL